MKIAHVADMHWGLGYPGPHPKARFDDITRSMDWVADRIIEEECELVLVAGDAFKDARVFLDRASTEISAFVAWLRKLSAAGKEIIVISGTPSHDAISAYHLINEMQIPNVLVYTEPGVCVSNNGVLRIGCLPGMNRSNFVTDDDLRGLPGHEIHQRMTEWITETCSDMRDQGATILMSHLTFDLADTGFEDALLQNEPILTDDAAMLFDLICLGHIHRPQHAGMNVFYSGAPERHSFSDEETKTGFWIHEVVGGKYGSKFIENSLARRFITLRWDGMEVEAWIDGQLDDLSMVKDAIVRVHYSCSEDVQKRFDRRTLEKALYDAGAFYVHEIKADIERSERQRDAEVTESLGPLSALTKWGENQGINADEIGELQAMTKELLEVAT